MIFSRFLDINALFYIKSLYSELKLFSYCCILERTLTVRIMVADGLTVAGRFGKSYGTRNWYFEE